MLIIGLAGGIASGKTFVAAEFQKLGAALIDADLLGHQALTVDSVRAQIVNEFGSEVTGVEGEIDRKKLAKLVFGNDTESKRRLQRLEAITHPEIARQIRHRLTDLSNSGVQVVILDAAVMFKSGWDKMCDRILFIECDESVRQRRALSRGWNLEELARREANQTLLAEKRRRATDFIQNNDQASPTIAEQIRHLWLSWTTPSTIQP
ncbi:MAG: dephospho-CoA kinase [Pirellulaceae bacterium]